MFLSPTMMRILLLLTMLAIALLAALFLRRRDLTVGAYLGWGILLILLPVLGPFLVLLIKPGTPKEKYTHLS